MASSDFHPSAWFRSRGKGRAEKGEGMEGLGMEGGRGNDVSEEELAKGSTQPAISIEKYETRFGDRNLTKGRFVCEYHVRDKRYRRFLVLSYCGNNLSRRNFSRCPL